MNAAESKSMDWIALAMKPNGGRVCKIMDLWGAGFDMFDRLKLQFRVEDFVCIFFFILDLCCVLFGCFSYNFFWHFFCYFLFCMLV